jgi:hypothetical protein
MSKPVGNTGDSKENVLIQLLEPQIDYIVTLCLRFGDQSPLLAHQELANAFLSILGQLGTDAHEAALTKLSNEYKSAATEARDAWAGIWRRFGEKRIEAQRFMLQMKEYRTVLKSQLYKVEDELKNLQGCDPDLAQLAQKTLAAAQGAEPVQIHRGWRKMPWLLLRADLCIYTVYVRYFAARATFALLRHAYIAVVSILICGIGYSRVVSALSAFTGSALVGLGASFLKTYYIDHR